MKFSLANNRFEDLKVTPHKTAVCGSNGNITWQQLHDKAQHMATLINELAIPAGHPVMIYGHKETDFVVVVVALMMNNIPYVPVDKVMPVERVHTLQQITQAQALINLTEIPAAIFDFPVIIGLRDVITKKTAPDYSKGIYWREQDPIRYIIFTSGSTGEPKGVQITAGRP